MPCWKPQLCPALAIMALLAIAATAFPAGSQTNEMPDPAQDRAAFAAWQTTTRQQLADMLGIPGDRVELQSESRGQFEADGIIIEKWVFTSEPESRIPAVLYRPKHTSGPAPGLALTFGHGGSKSKPDYDYAGQLFAKLGIICLAADPIGEEERNIHGAMGTRSHDPAPVHQAAWDAGRPIMGKLVFDTMRGVDFLLARRDVDPRRVGVAGNSLGGAVAAWMAALDTRLSFAVVSGWAFTPVLEKEGKLCTRIPNQEMRKLLTWPQYVSLAAPHCSMLVANGDADVIIDRGGQGEAWRDTRQAVEQANRVYAALGRPAGIHCWFAPGGGHRPYPAHPEVLAWLVEQIHPEHWNAREVMQLPRLNFGQWGDANGIRIEPLYNTDLHVRGATVADLQITYRPREQLAVLQPEEIGHPEFALEGWLEQIAGNAAK
jgi:dienelactone hydrolase